MDLDLGQNLPVMAPTRYARKVVVMGAPMTVSWSLPSVKTVSTVPLQIATVPCLAAMGNAF